MKGIQKIEAEREARRAKMKEAQMAKEEMKKENIAMGRNQTDVDYQIMIDKEKAQVGAALNHVSATNMSICICVRKRPLFEKEF